MVKICEGRLPPGTSGATALVIEDLLYLYGGYRESGNTNDLFCLDLRTMEWRKLEPQGLSPTPADKFAGWTYRNKLYFFGGFSIVPDRRHFQHQCFSFVLDNMTPWSYRRGWTNQLFCYDPATNMWSWPSCKGTVPLPRAAHAAAVQRDHLVFIFGGRHQQWRMNDLYCLDMETMTWSSNLTRDDLPSPQGRSWHTLTPLGRDYVVLYGGFNQRNDPLSDCWWYDLNKAQWQRITSVAGDKPRLWHTAVLTPCQEVVIYGGCTENILDHSIVADHKTSDIIVLRFSPKSLVRLCLDYLVRHPADLAALPRHLQAVLLQRRAASALQHTTLGGS